MESVTVNSFKFCMLCVFLATAAMAAMEEDEKDCADQMANLASCMPYVSGSAQKPTPECCEDTVKVKTAKPKCLCVLIKDSTDPSMGLPINTTLALQMPALCNIDARISDCPAILKLPPNSPGAKIFQAANADSGNTSPSTAATASASPSTPSSSDSKTTTASSSGSYGGMKLAQTILIVISALVFV